MLELAEIRTERLVLTPLEPDLVRALLSQDYSSVKVGDGWPHVDTRDGLEMAGECGGWLVISAGSVIGDCGLVGAVSAGVVEIGYGLAVPSRGQGFGTELITGLCRWLLGQQGILKVRASVGDVGNWPSRRALESAGFELERVDENAAVYALVAGVTNPEV